MKNFEKTGSKKLINLSGKNFLSGDEYQSFMLKKKFFRLAFSSSYKRDFRLQNFFFDRIKCLLN